MPVRREPKRPWLPQTLLGQQRWRSSILTTAKAHASSILIRDRQHRYPGQMKKGPWTSPLARRVQMNTSLGLSGLRTVLIQCVPRSSHTQPGSRPDIAGIHNTWESTRWGAVSCFSSRTADLCNPPPPNTPREHTHTHHEASPRLMNPKLYPSAECASAAAKSG